MRVNSSVLPKPSGTSADDLVMHVQNDRIAGGFDALHSFGEQIAGDRLHNVFRPVAAVGAAAVTTVAPAAGGVVVEQHDAALRIGKFGAG